MLLITSNAATVARHIREFGKRLPALTMKGLDIWARRTAIEVKRAAPAGKTRALRRTIMGRGMMTGGKPTALIVARVKHAIWIEYGTKRHFVAPVRRKALRWIGKRGYLFSRGHHVGPVPARPFFFPLIKRKLVTLAPTIAGLCRAALRR